MASPVPKSELDKTKNEILNLIGKSQQDLEKDGALMLKVDFFLSSVFPYSRYSNLEEIVKWLDGFRKKSDNLVEKVGIKDLDKWYVEEGTGNIRHDSGKFFSIEGVKVELKGREVASWCQPIINQPEVGILGIIVKKVEGVYYFLMQAKTEPGNIDGYQISPTVQATKSNYTKVHGGKLPPFVEIFLDRRNGKVKVLVESLQSEEGARFWKKNNLNVVLEIGENEMEEVPPEFRWMTLYQLKKLLLKDNMVNICARTVLSCLP